MQVNNQARAMIQSYLTDVAAHLEGMPAQEQRDLLRQLESHIHEALAARTGGQDAQASDVQAVLSDMDPAESYATPSKDRLWNLSRGKWAFVISLAGVVAAAALLALGSGRLAGWVPFFLGAEIAACILGSLSWRESFGKAAVCVSAAVTVITLLSCA